MKNAALFIIFLLFFFACNENDEPYMPEVQHFVLDDVLNHIPLDQFNNFSKAIYRNIDGNEFDYRLSVDEEIVDRIFSDIIYSSNQISLLYSTNFNLAMPNFSIVAALDNLKDVGYTEFINCNSGIVAPNNDLPYLTIIPNKDYKNAILNEEFTWMDQDFSNVYSKMSDQENESDKVTIFYQPSMGIIGFTDVLGNPWILDRFE